MTSIICVSLDKEMVEEFSGKFTRHVSEDLHPGTTVLLYGEWFFEKDGQVFAVFRRGPVDTFRYDREFTEWLKVHRPELFL